MPPAEKRRWARFGRLWWVRLLLPVWIQHLWLVVITVLVVLALSGIQGQTDAIQRERAHATRDGCRDQNARHDRTVARLRQLVADLPPGPRRRRAQRNIGSTIALIDALAPRQDCEALVRERVRVEPSD